VVGDALFELSRHTYVKSLEAAGENVDVGLFDHEESIATPSEIRGPSTTAASTPPPVGMTNFYGANNTAQYRSTVPPTF